MIEEHIVEGKRQDTSLDEETFISSSRGRSRGRGRTRSTVSSDGETAPEPFVLRVNPYVVSPQNALDLMAKICSAEPSANRIKWIEDIKKIFDNFKFTDLVKNNRNLLLNPTFDKDVFYVINRLVFAMENESFGNHPRVRIAVSGLFNAGKSALLNHLIRQPNLLPENSNPSTVVPAYLYCRKEIEENHIFGVNQYRALIQLDESAINGIEHKLEEGKEGAIQKGASEQIATALHHFIVEIPHNDFDKMVFIDTPGFGNAGSRDNRIAKDCIDSADMLLYLVDCHKGSLAENELKFINSFSASKRPIVVIITRNDLMPRKKAEDVFKLVTSQVSSTPLVKDVICMSVRNNNNFWSRSGLPLENSLQTAAKSAICTTAIDKLWLTIEDLFEKEVLHLGKQVAKLQNSRTEVITAKIEIEKEYNQRLEVIPNNVETVLNTNAILCENDTLHRLKKLTEYYKCNYDEDIERHQRIINVFEKSIKESSDIQDILKRVLEKLSWWKSDTIRQLHSVKYVKRHNHSSYSVFDSVNDLSDVNLSKLINSLIEGCDIITKYNDDGFSVLTYTAYCGNIPALLFILNRISERYVFMRDKKKRNIFHAAAEGLQINTLQLLKQKFPKNILSKDSQGKTCDEILLDKIKLNINKYEN